MTPTATRDPNFDLLLPDGLGLDCSFPPFGVENSPHRGIVVRRHSLSSQFGGGAGSPKCIRYSCVTWGVGVAPPHCGLVVRDHPGRPGGRRRRSARLGLAASQREAKRPPPSFYLFAALEEAGVTRSELHLAPGRGRLRPRPAPALPKPTSPGRLRVVALREALRLLRLAARAPGRGGLHSGARAGGWRTASPARKPRQGRGGRRAGRRRARGAAGPGRTTLAPPPRGRAPGGGLQLQGDRREARSDLHEREPAADRGPRGAPPAADAA